MSREGTLMSKNVSRRIQALEARFASVGTVLLTMPNGTIQKLSIGRRGPHTWDLFQKVMRDPECSEAVAIRASVVQIDSDGGKLGELMNALLNSP
jgi:hypothetical protein